MSNEKEIEELAVKVICPKRDVCTKRDYDRTFNHAHCHPHKHNRNCDDENRCSLKDSKCVALLPSRPEPPEKVVEAIDRLLESLINTTWVELLENEPEVMYAQHELESTRNSILSLLPPQLSHDKEGK